MMKQVEIVDQIQEWLDEIYTNGSTPECSFTWTCTTEALMIGDIYVWDDQSGYGEHFEDSELTVANVKAAYQAAVEELAFGFRELAKAAKEGG